MSHRKLKNWLSKSLSCKARNATIVVWYILSLVIPARKHSLDNAARLSGLHNSQFTRFLQNHSELAAKSLKDLSRKQAKKVSRVMTYLKGTSWKIAIVVDSTIQHRSRRHTENAKRFNHGKGFVIGHQWTNIILIINDMVIPLPPISFYTKKYCRQNGLKYKTEHDSVVDYITNLDLEDYIGTHKSQEVVFLGDSGYDCTKIETAIMKKKWKFIMALSKTRSVKSEKQYLSTPESKDWTQIAEFFKNHRWLKWLTIRILTNGSKIKRKDFRIRQITGYLRNVGKVQLICSEFKKRPDGRRKYLACNDFKATARQILLGYRIRWLIEIFHKEVKMHLGFEDVATRSFKAVMAHVHWVYCAYILLNDNPPGVPDNVTGIIAKQHRIKEIVESKKTGDLLQLSTRFDGLSIIQHELREALQHR